MLEELFVCQNETQRDEMKRIEMRKSFAIKNCQRSFVHTTFLELFANSPTLI